MNMTVLPGIIAIALLVATQAGAAPEVTADREIRQVIDFVARSDCTFIRNGDAHAPTAAASHLSMKYGKARTKLSTPEQFIEYVATRSSFTGREYRVQCPGRKEQASGTWLLDALREHRKMAPVAPVATTAAAPLPSPGELARDWRQHAQTRPD